MEAEIKIVNGAYRVDTQGEIELVTRNNAVVQAEAGRVDVIAAESVSLNCGDAVVSIEKKLPASADVKVLVGPLGKIVLASGPPVGGPRIEMDTTSITLSIGPPVGGVSIKLSLESITLRVAANASLKLSLTGIDERVGLNTRSHDFAAHSLEAAETEIKVGVEGITMKAPLMKEDVMGLAQIKNTLSKADIAAMNKEVSGIDMIN